MCHYFCANGRRARHLLTLSHLLHPGEGLVWDKPGTYIPHPFKEVPWGGSHVQM
jgi:hypothetical protein